MGHPNPGFDLHTEAYKLFGVAVTQILGLEENTLPLFSEAGRDRSRWPTEAHFVSWLALCPDHDISNGKLLWRRGMRVVKNRTGHLFRLAAYSRPHGPTPMGGYLRRMKAKLAPKAATTATPHMIAIILDTMVKNQVEYDETTWVAKDAARGKRLEAKLKRQAKQLGYPLSQSSRSLSHNQLFTKGSRQVPWKRCTHSCVPRSHSCQRFLDAGRW
jgi:hypothetical protein